MYKNYVYFNKEKSIEKYEQKMFGNSIFTNMIIVSFLIYDEYNIKMIKAVETLNK